MQFPDLVPTHVVWPVEVHGLGCHEQRERQPGGAQTRPSLGVDREKGVVDRNGQAPVWQRLAVLQTVDDMGERQDVVPGIGQLPDMGLELFQPDVGRAVLLFSEPVIDYHRSRIGSG